MSSVQSSAPDKTSTANDPRGLATAVAALALAAITFIADLSAPIGGAAGILYFGVACLLTRLPSKAGLRLGAAGISMLLVAGFLLGPTTGDLVNDFLNRLLAFAAVTATVILTGWHREDANRLEESRDTLAARQSRLELLHRLNASSRASMPTADLLEQAVRDLSAAFPECRVTYSEVDFTGLLQVKHCATPAKLDDTSGKTADLSAAPELLATIHRVETIVLGDTHDDALTQPVADKLDALGTRSIAGMPVHHGAGQCGFLSFESDQPREWRDYETETLIAVAEALAFILKESGTRDRLKVVQKKLHESATALLETNRQLEVATREAENSNRAKSVFLANMSHEIRTPMTAILGYADILEEYSSAGDLPAECDEAVRSIQLNASHLLQIINDILDISKIEAGKLEVDTVEVSTGLVLNEIRQVTEVRMKEGGIDFSIELESPIPALIETDPLRLKQILINLISNAAKFTREGGVRVVARHIARVEGLELGAVPTSAREPEHFLEIDVIDTGVGMSEEQAARLFKPFTQAEASTSRDFGGTGLGLSISRQLAEMMGGQLVLVRTRPGEGSTFRLTLPAASDEGQVMLSTLPDERAEVKAPVRTDAQLDCRVLVAEDNMTNQRIIQRLLEKAGAHVDLAINGQEAVELVRASAESPYDVVLMDMQMPVMDGYTATRTLRTSGEELPIIALTASALDTDRRKCLAAGCTEHEPKPIDRNSLFNAILKQISP